MKTRARNIIPVIAMIGLFGMGSGVKAQTEAVEVSQMDSSSGWQCKITGACAGGKGICCASGVQSHLKDIQNIEKVEVDREKSLVTVWIKKGETVEVKEITKVLGGHWTLQAIEKMPAQG